MRANEFIVEYKISARKKYKGVKVTVTDDKGKQIAFAEFGNYLPGPKYEKTLEAQYVFVEPKYQKQGIARAMYDLVKSRGYTIFRSGDQTFDGSKFWDKSRGKDEYVWEDHDHSQPEIYLDMDGVLADFMAGYNRVAGTNYGPGQQLPHPSEDPTLKKITGTDFFSTLPKFASADALVRMVVDQYGHYNICSSPLRGDHENSAANKRAWLMSNLQPQPREIVITSRKEKYATQPDGTPNILVDDKPENIQRWKAAGGIGILYNAAVDGLDTVASGLQLNENFADGKIKGKSRPGRVKRAGASCSGSVTSLRAKAKKYGGEKGKMYHWCANMKSGRKKNK